MLPYTNARVDHVGPKAMSVKIGRSVQTQISKQRKIYINEAPKSFVSSDLMNSDKLMFLRGISLSQSFRGVLRADISWKIVLSGRSMASKLELLARFL